MRTARGLGAKHVTLSRRTLLKRTENAKSLLFTELKERDFIEVEGLMVVSAQFFGGGSTLVTLPC